MSTDKDFWSRRRAAVAAEKQAERQAEVRKAELAEAEAARAELQDLSDEQLLEKLDLPDPDTLEPGDDFTAFLRDVVPEHLRRRALRRLWRSNPVLANLDGLNDYDGDYTNAATDAPGLKTAYRVGKGLLKHVEVLAAEAEAKAEVAARAEDTEAGPEGTEPDATGPPAEAEQDIALAEAESLDPFPEPDVVAEEDGSPRPSRRRITFSFNG
ncbi:DUF3306 domain-containing protein [Halovulum sp. GXIMD14794]